MKAKIAIFSSLILAFIILGIVSSNQVTNTSINQNSSNYIAGVRYAAANTPLEDPVIPNPDFAVYKGYVLDAYGNPISGAQISYKLYEKESQNPQEIDSGSIQVSIDGSFGIEILKIHGISFTASAPGYESTSISLSVSNYIIFTLYKIPTPPTPTPPPIKQLIP